MRLIRNQPNQIRTAHSTYSTRTATYQKTCLSLLLLIPTSEEKHIAILHCFQASSFPGPSSPGIYGFSWILLLPLSKYLKFVNIASFEVSCVCYLVYNHNESKQLPAFKKQQQQSPFLTTTYRPMLKMNVVFLLIDRHGFKAAQKKVIKAFQITLMSMPEIISKYISLRCNGITKHLQQTCLSDTLSVQAACF